MQQRRWIIKTSEGLLRGPYSTEEVLSRIQRGEYSGEELISKYPGADWYPISKDPTFYDRLLDALARQGEEELSEDPRPGLSDLDGQATVNDKGSGASSSELNEIPGPELDELTPVPQPGFSAASKTKPRKKPEPESIADIELVDIQERLKREVARRAWLPALVAILILAAGVYLLLSPEPAEEERVRLLAPRLTQNLHKEEQARTLLSRGVQDYLRDTFSGYVRSQNQLVQAAESDPRNPEIFALLCLTYFELWPFAFQDSADLRTISQVTQAVSAIDPAGMHSATCKAVDLIIKGRFSEAYSLTNSALESLGSSGQPPIPLYYLRAVLADSSGDPQVAIGYLTSAQQLWPQWIRAFVYQAQLYARLENYTEAARIYRSVLLANPNHEVTKIELGVLEYRSFRNHQRAEELIKSALAGQDRVSRRLLSKGFFGLAEIALNRRDQSDALNYARKAYGADSTNSLAKNLVIQLGGSKALAKTKFRSFQLIAEGDQFAREGDCNAAQAHYKAAFESGNKNAIAAMKAGECLWRLSLTSEAIEWMNKAIRADPKLTEAYVTLADYYTQRFNFSAAAQVLIAGQREAPKSYEIYRGFALVELRRRNPKGAIEYGKQALAIYETDVETHVIMADAYADLRDKSQALTSATKARELDVNNRRAQIVYARALGLNRGTDAGIDFLSQLVKAYPLVTDYRLALGKLYLEDERFPDAEGTFADLLQIDERVKEAWILLGTAQRKQDRYEQALDSFLRAAVLDPADGEPLYQAGILYLEVNKPEEARVQFQRVLKVNKLYPMVHYQLGRAALMLNDAKEALNEAREERNVNPNLADAYLLAAEAYSALQQYSLCVSEYQKAIKLRPQSAMILIKVAQCYRKADQYDAAVAMLRQAGVLESGLAEVYRELGIVYEIKGELPAAIESYNQYFALSPNAPDRRQIEDRILTLQRGLGR